MSAASTERPQLLIVARPPLAAFIALATTALDVDAAVSDERDAARVASERRPSLAVIECAAGRTVPTLGLPWIAIVHGAGLQSKLDALAQGAIDVVGLPFEPADMALRIATALGRVSGRVPAARDGITRGQIRIDLTSGRVHIDGTNVRLSPLEQRIFLLLLANEGAVATREDILELAWGNEIEPHSNLIDRHVRDLRRKLSDDWRRPSYIATVRGAGYMVSLREPAT